MEDDGRCLAQNLRGGRLAGLSLLGWAAPVTVRSAEDGVAFLALAHGAGGGRARRSRSVRDEETAIVSALRDAQVAKVSSVAHGAERARGAYARPASTPWRPWHGSRKRGRLAKADPLGRRTRRGRITLCSRSSRRCRRSSASRSSRKICQRRDHPRVPSGMRTSWTSWFSSSHRRSSNGGGTEQAHCQCRPLCPSRLGHRRRGRGLSRCSPPVALLPLLAVPYPGPAARQRAQLRWRRFFHGSPSSRRW